MSAYTYESYRFTGRKPMVRIMRNVRSQHGKPVDPDWTLDVHTSWPWENPHTLDLGDDIMLDITPLQGKATKPYATWGVIAYGRVHAMIRRWGATMPIEVADPRVVERLRLREVMEAM